MQTSGRGELANLINRAADTIEALLTERTGEWVNGWTKVDGGRMYGANCSLCGINGHSGYKYCPNCGARMKEVYEGK